MLKISIVDAGWEGNAESFYMRQCETVELTVAVKTLNSGCGSQLSADGHLLLCGLGEQFRRKKAGDWRPPRFSSGGTACYLETGYCLEIKYSEKPVQRSQ